MHTVHWEVICLSTIKVVRSCKRCGVEQRFFSSGLFRVNANGKLLDVWLIYRCGRCGAAWNLPIHSRVHAGRFKKEELEGYYKNDVALADQYAMDEALLKRNGAKTAPPEYRLEGDGIEKGVEARLHVHVSVPLPARLYKALKDKLQLTAAGMDALIDSGQIRIEGETGDLKKRKLLSDVTLMIRLEADQPGAGGAGPVSTNVIHPFPPRSKRRFYMPYAPCCRKKRCGAATTFLQGVRVPYIRC